MGFYRPRFGDFVNQVDAIWKAPDETNTGYFCYTYIGQHSECALNYIKGLLRLTWRQALRVDRATVRDVDRLYGKLG